MVMNKYEKQAKEARKKTREDRKKWKGCESKKKFDNEDESKFFNNVEAKSYRCKYCGFWHRTEAFNTLVNTLKKYGRKK